MFMLEMQYSVLTLDCTIIPYSEYCAHLGGYVLFCSPPEQCDRKWLLLRGSGAEAT